MAITGGRARTVGGGSIESQGGNFFLRRDGGNSPTANINWGNFQLTGVQAILANSDGAGSVGNAAIAWGTGWFRNVRPDAGENFNMLDSAGVNRLVLIGGGECVLNEGGLDRDTRLEGDGDSNLGFWDAGTDRFGVGTGTPLGKIDIVQADASGGVPPVRMSQADLTVEFIEFDTTIGVGNPMEAVGAKTLTVTHFAKTNIVGVGVRYFALGTIA